MNLLKVRFYASLNSRSATKLTKILPQNIPIIQYLPLLKYLLILEIKIRKVTNLYLRFTQIVRVKHRSQIFYCINFYHTIREACFDANLHKIYHAQCHKNVTLQYFMPYN